MEEPLDDFYDLNLRKFSRFLSAKFDST